MPDAVRELIEAAKKMAQMAWAGPKFYTEAAMDEQAEFVMSAIAALEAAEVPTQPEVCRWKDVGLECAKSGCGNHWCDVSADTFTYCPDCGRKIEVTHE